MYLLDMESLRDVFTIVSLMCNFSDTFILLVVDHYFSVLDILCDQDDDHIYKIILKKTPIPENIDNRVTKLLIDFANTINE